MNNFRLLNWDYSNWPLGGGGGGGTGLPSQPGHAGQFLQTDGTNPLWATVSFSSLSGKPTTIAGYGILDGFALANNFSELANTTLGGNAATARLNLGLQIGVNVQAYSSNLATWSGKTPYAGSLSITTGKTVGFINSLTFSGTDGATLGIGGGGTLGSAAFTASSAYDASGAAAAAQAASQPLNGDLTAISGLSGTNTIYYRSGSPPNNWTGVSIGTGLSFTGGTLSATGGGGGGGSVNGPTASPTPGEVVIYADNTGTLLGRANSYSGIATLSAGVLGATATVPVTQGGTGLNTISTGDILYGSASNTISRLGANTSATANQYLRSVNSAIPSWSQVQFTDLGSVPTTLLGYGITDALKTTNNLSEIALAGTTAQASARGNLGLTIGTNVEAWDADLDQLAAQTAIAVSPTTTQETGIPFRKTTTPTWSTIKLGTGLTLDNSTGIITATNAGAGNVISDTTGTAVGQLPVFNNTLGTHITNSTLANGILKSTTVSTVPAIVATAAVNQDYSQAITGTITSLGTAIAPTTWPVNASSQPVTLAAEASPAPMSSADGYTKLPAANSFAGGTILTYQDFVTTGNYGRQFTAFNNGTDFWDGNAYGTYVRPFIAGGTSGQGTYQFQTDGVHNWRSVYAQGRATRVISPNDASKVATFNVENFPTATTNVISFWRGGPSATGADTPEDISGVGLAKKFLSGFHANADSGSGGDPLTAGSFITDYVHPTDLNYRQADITNSSIVDNGSGANPRYTVTSGTAGFPSDGSIDTIRWNVTTMPGPVTVYVPPTVNYQSSEPIAFFDRVGAINSTNTVTIASSPLSTPSDTFNGSASVTLKDQFSVLTFRSDGGGTGGAAGNWSYPVPGSTSPTSQIGQFVPLTDAGTITKACDQSLNEQNWKLLSTGTVGTTRNINVTNARDGERGTIEFTHNSSGGDTFVLLNSRTLSGGTGVLHLSTAANAVDVVEWRMIGTKVTVTNVALNMTAAAALTCTNAGTVTGTSAGIGAFIGNSAARKYIANRFAASTTSHSTSFCNVQIPIYKTGSVAAGTQITLYIYNDSSGPAAPPLFTSSAIDVSAVSATDITTALASLTTFAFPSTVTLTNGTNYYAVLGVSAVGSSANHFSVVNTTATVLISTSTDGVTWTTPVTGNLWLWTPYY
jgi:hypothetical protein